MKEEHKRKVKAPSGKGQAICRLELIGILEKESFPEATAFALNRSGEVLDRAEVRPDGEFAFSPKALESAHEVAIGPEGDFASADRTQFQLLRASEVQESMAAGKPILIAKPNWTRWIPTKHCVNGKVRHCFPWWPFKLALTQHATRNHFSLRVKESARSVFALKKPIALAAHSLKIPHLIWPPQHCAPVCDGLVEVYQRRCCCKPWVIFDPRLPRLIDELDGIIPRPPEIGPPGPQPDPIPFRKIEEMGLIRSGTLDERVMNARTDLAALKALPPEHVASYINARPYLFCWKSCGKAVKKATGTIRPDGTFTICWKEWPGIKFLHCYDEVSFVVKQNIDGSTVTIYNGLAAGKWFRYPLSGVPELTSYHPGTISCDPPPDFGPGAFSILQDIGLARSWRLKTPNATAWDRVASPVYNDGLADPVATAAAAKGQPKNRNWGGLLRLRYHFSEPMKALGAAYYRVSVVKSNASGNPVGNRKYLSPSEWSYYQVVGSDIFVKKESLGPRATSGDEVHLYEIPYHSGPKNVAGNNAWLSGQYHALLDTTDYPDGRFLLTLEIFNSAGKLLRPNGTAGPAESLQKAFTYRRMYQESGPTAVVPFSGLTHMFWWDNRRAKAKIEDLRSGGVPDWDQCQFLTGSGTTMFSVGYRAYHPEAMFHLTHRLTWKRGLGGSSGVLSSPEFNPENVGIPPADPHQSASKSFSDMLQEHPKCSFSLKLHVDTKTFNGFGALNHLDKEDLAAFALEITP